jgi:hypothetical protein
MSLRAPTPLTREGIIAGRMGNVRSDSHTICPADLHRRANDSRRERLTHEQRLANALDLFPGDIHDSGSFLERTSCFSTRVLKDPWLAVDHKYAGHRLVVLGCHGAKPLRHDLDWQLVGGCFLKGF